MGATNADEQNIVKIFRAPNYAIALKTKEGKFPSYELFLEAERLGARSFADYLLVLRREAPDFGTALKVKEGGFSDYNSYLDEISVGATTIELWKKVRELGVPDYRPVERMISGGFPDYASFKDAEERGAFTLAEFEMVKKYGRETYQEARMHFLSDIAGRMNKLNRTDYFWSIQTLSESMGIPEFSVTEILKEMKGTGLLEGNVDEKNKSLFRTDETNPLAYAVQK